MQTFRPEARPASKEKLVVTWTLPSANPFLSEDVVLELARLEREAMAKVRTRIAAQQLGEAFHE